MPASGLYARHVDGLKLENATFATDSREAVVLDDSTYAVADDGEASDGELAPKAVFGGFAGRKAAALFEGRVFSRYAMEDAMDEAVRAFETKEDDTRFKIGWQGEYWGRTMLGHTGAVRIFGRKGHREYVVRQADRLLDGFMRPDGYLGTYSDPKAVVETWNVWGRKYTVWGLVEAYEVTGESRFLDAAEKTLNQLFSMLGEMNLSLRDTGCFNGLPSCSLLQPLAILQRHRPSDANMARMRAIVSDWDRADGAAPNLVANAFSGKPLHEWYPDPVKWAKTAEILNCYEGLVEYALLTGERRPLEATERAADLIAEHETNPMGGVGYFDHLTHAAANPNGTVEMCDAMYWIRLCHALYRATGETRHLDRAERCFCNAVLAGIYDCGRWGAYSVRSHGWRQGTAALAVGMRHHTCCVDNMPRAVFSFSDNIAFERDGILEVNHYLPAKTRLADGTEVEISGNYPVSEEAKVAVVSSSAAKLALRVPGWCKEMSVGGTRVAPSGGRAVFDIPAGRSEFALRFAMPARIVHRPDLGGPALLAGHECDGKGNDGALFLMEQPKVYPEMDGAGRDTLAAFVMRGPLVLAKSSRLGLCEKEVFATETVNGDVSWRATARPLASVDGVWGEWELTFEKGAQRRVFRVCDLASATPSGDWHDAFSIWF